MSYKIIIIEENDKYVLRYVTDDGFFITEEYKKTSGVTDLGITISKLLQVK